MKVHAIPHVIFETIRSEFFQILHQLLSVMKDNSTVFVSSNLIYFRQMALRNEILGLLIGWGKIHKTPHVILETTSQFFFRLCITLQCHER